MQYFSLPGVNLTEMYFTLTLSMYATAILSPDREARQTTCHLKSANVYLLGRAVTIIYSNSNTRCNNASLCNLLSPSRAGVPFGHYLNRQCSLITKKFPYNRSVIEQKLCLNSLVFRSIFLLHLNYGLILFIRCHFWGHIGLRSGRGMMTSSNGNIFRVTGPLCGEFTGHRWIPRTKASNAELWCFLWSAPE